MEVKIVTTPFVVGDPVWFVDLGGVKDYTVYPGRVGAVVLSMGKEQIKHPFDVMILRTSLSAARKSSTCSRT